MNREVIDTWLERGILVFVLAVLTLGTLALGGVRPLEFALLRWLILGAGFLWLVRIWAAPTFRFLWPPVCWAIVPFVAYALWRWQTADVEFLAREEVMLAVFCALLFVITINNLYSQESVRVLSLFLIGLAMVVSMYGVYQWLRESPTVWGLQRPAAYVERASGTFVNPNHFAGFLEMILPLAIALALLGRVNVIIRICVVYAAFVIMAGIAASESRGGWIATGVGVCVLFGFLLRTARRRWLVLAAFALVLATGQWLYSTSVKERVTTAQYAGHNREVRFRLWNSAWNMWKEHPWWGVGPDHFDHRYRAYREAADVTQGRPGRVHNDYLNTLTDYGAVGLALILLPIGFAAYSVVRFWPHMQRSGSEFGEKRSNRSALVVGATAALASMLAHSFFDFNMHIPANAFLFTTLLAVLCSHWRFATERYWFTARWPLAIASSVALIATLGLLGHETVTRTRESLLLRRADKLPDGSEQKIALMRRAFDLQPKNYETAFAIGEQLRALAWQGREDNQERAREALPWFERAITLNKWEVIAYLRAGMTLDWLGRHQEADPYFERAIKLDPNHWQARALMGWHQFQKENFKEAAEWFRQSLKVNWTENGMAYTYLHLSETYLREEAAGLQWPTGRR